MIMIVISTISFICTMAICFLLGMGFMEIFYDDFDHDDYF